MSLRLQIADCGIRIEKFEISNPSVMGSYLARKGRKVLPPKPCKAVIEVMPIGRPALCMVFLGREPTQFNG